MDESVNEFEIPAELAALDISAVVSQSMMPVIDELLEPEPEPEPKTEEGVPPLDADPDPEPEPELSKQHEDEHDHDEASEPQPVPEPGTLVPNETSGSVTKSPDRAARSTSTFTPSVHGSPAQSGQLASPSVALMGSGGNGGPGPDGGVAAAAQAVAALGKVELAMYVARHDSIIKMESRLQEHRDQLQLERQEMLLELERSQQEMELCRSELRARQEEIDSLRNEAAVRLEQDTAFFKQQRAEIERLRAAELNRKQQLQPQPQHHSEMSVDKEALSLPAELASTRELGLATISPQPQVQAPLMPHVPSSPSPPLPVRPTAVISDEQLSALQARLLAMHAAELLQDEELYHLEDVCADFIAIRSALAGGVVTQDVVHGGGSQGAAALVSTLVGVSEAMSNDGSFARQCRRWLRPQGSRQAGHRAEA